MIVIRAAQAAQLRESLESVDIEDSALNDSAYQQAILARVKEVAGASFDDLAGQATSRLAEPPWFVLIRGLPPIRATPILVAVSAALGLLVEPYRQPWSRVVRHVLPSRDRVIDGRVLNEDLHTDGTDWPSPQ